MNKKQKIILICVAVVAVIMLLFPPFHLVAMRGTIGRDYGFFFSPHDNGAVVDTGMLFIQILVVLIVGGVAFIFAHGEIPMARLMLPCIKFRYKKSIIFSVTIIALAAAWIIYDPINLWIAHETKKDFLFDEAVGRENKEFNSTMLDFQPIPPLPAGSKLDFPSYMEKYGLHFDEYRDKTGKLSPLGSHWATWGTKARIVAAINWGGDDLSARQILHVIDCVNDHINQYDPSKPIAPIIRVCAKKPQAKLDLLDQASPMTTQKPDLSSSTQADDLPVDCDIALGTIGSDFYALEQGVPPPPSGFEVQDTTIKPNSICWYHPEKFRKLYPMYSDVKLNELREKLYKKANITNPASHP